MKGVIVALTALASASCAATTSVVKPGLHDAEGYAIASCLAKQQEPFLQQQGGGWASVVIERGNVDLERLMLIDDRVREVVAKGGMPVVHDESSATGDATLPVLYCVGIVENSSVRAAIDQAIPAH